VPTKRSSSALLTSKRTSPSLPSSNKQTLNLKPVKPQSAPIIYPRTKEEAIREFHEARVMAQNLKRKHEDDEAKKSPNKKAKREEKKVDKKSKDKKRSSSERSKLLAKKIREIFSDDEE